ncbi:adenosylcobinamide-GDP ribazoletransferase [Pseudomonas sp. NW5]|uniref:adenosylcobinamide-GDP ribazoletransferase n=1 Tax=Pseudomonas sp. NW5 TaxID=2934934 RepID=UPI002020E9B6|nr:adenosylcobinamide-GDP ribazoletransferase [Pseudomonas sp. NW5]MCL7462523.1 adenosylcobinamide-GDP ribazoletransferase [Pseudomonas sp. NW5]
MLPLLIALQFLTRIPIRLPGMPAPAELGRSLLCYPLVGALLGGGLALLAVLLAETFAPLAAALLLAVWVLASGALHLDGLADTVDAWVGGYGDRARTLALMKDPASGPMAVAALILLLLLKFTALWALLLRGEVLALLLAALLARGAVLLLFWGTPYVRAGGLGSVMAEQLPRRPALWVLALVALTVLLAGRSGALALASTLVVFVLCRRALLRRLGGTTGDTAGALLELVECSVLVVLALAG